MFLEELMIFLEAKWNRTKQKFLQPPEGEASVYAVDFFWTLLTEKNKIPAVKQARQGRMRSQRGPRNLEDYQEILIHTLSLKSLHISEAAIQLIYFSTFPDFGVCLDNTQGTVSRTPSWASVDSF